MTDHKPLTREWQSQCTGELVRLLRIDAKEARAISRQLYADHYADCTPQDAAAGEASYWAAGQTNGWVEGI